MTDSFDAVPRTAEDSFEPSGSATDPDSGIAGSESDSGTAGSESEAASPAAVAANAENEEPADHADSGTEQQTPVVRVADPIGELIPVVTQLVTESQKHHARAAQRETVIDRLHAELERLRTGERRGTIRPLLMSVARIRDDLVRQAAELPSDFDAIRAQKLLGSFADSIAILLDDYGVAIFSPAVGDAFDVRRHRAVSSLLPADGALAGTIASVRRDGYQDVETGVPLKQAEVLVYAEANGTAPDSMTAEPVSADDQLAAPGLPQASFALADE